MATNPKPDRATRAAEGIWDSVVAGHRGFVIEHKDAIPQMADIIRAEYQEAEELARAVELVRPKVTFRKDRLKWCLPALSWESICALTRKFLEE